MNSWIGWILIVAVVLSLAVNRFWGHSTDEAPDVLASQDAPKIVRHPPARKARAPESLPTFGGYPCTSSDCAEDKAGFRWAAGRDIADPDDCAGDTSAFIEGCRVYAQQRAGNRE